MARRKGSNRDSNRPQIINNIASVNMEIDYDKLAEAIVKAQEKSVDKSEQTTATNKNSFWCNLCKVLKGEPLTNSSTVIALSSFMAIIMNGLAICCTVLFLILFISPIYHSFTTFEWSGANIIDNILAIVTFLVFSFVAISFSLVFRAVANEIKYEKDKNYIVTLFSSLIGIFALIVAIIELYKGVV
ncbi:MAG: hypothetical protein E7384_08240 [Ruminococcaceae bacterium]|nr:hypothetical protein [Oscillospiraceae bacterium]